MVPLSLFIGSWVYLSNRRKTLNKLFFLLSVAIISYPTFGYLTFFATKPDVSLFWAKWAYASGTWFLTVFYFFFIHFFKEERKFKLFQIFIIICSIFIILISFFTNSIVKEIKIQEVGAKPVFGPGSYLFYLFAFIIFIFIFYRFYKNYIPAPKDERIRIKYFFFGTVIFIFLSIFFDVVIPVIRGTFELHQFANYAGIILLSLTAYSMIRGELFGVRLILTALLVALIAILLFLDAIVLTEKLFFQVIKGFILILFLYIGYLLIRSVLLEIQRRTEIQRLYEEVDRLSRAKSEFISIASHQLRTPLTAVKGYISMIIEGTYGKLPEKLTKPLENVYQSNERLIKLVNDLLNLSRLEAGKLEFKPEPTSLEKIISAVIEELKITATKKGLYLKIIKSPESLPKIMVDRDKLRQVILNIIDNAIKYTKNGGVTIELRRLNSKEQIRISDTGEGMTKNEVKSLFQMFSRATAGTQLHTEGAGIGLYVAKKFIEMHGGKIWAESQGKGKGSTFYIELPLSL